MLGKLQQIPHAGAPKTVDPLVIVAHHAKVAVRPRQAQQDPFLDVGRVLVFVNQQIADAGCDGVRDAVIQQPVINPRLQVGEVHQVLIPQGCLVPPVAAAHRGQEGDAGVDQVLGSNQLLDDAVKMFGGLVQIPVPVAPQPAAQGRLVGTEYAMEMSRKQVQPLPSVQQRVGGAQDPATDAVDRGNADPVQVAAITGGRGGAAETLAQFGGGGLAEGA